MKSSSTRKQFTNCVTFVKNWCNGFSQSHKILSSVFVISLLFFSAQVFGQSANLDQIRNGTLGVYPATPTADWVNGNAGPSNAHFAEGYSIPYRVSVSSLVGDATTIHHLIVEWDTKHGNGHAIDYITHYQNLDNPVGSHTATFGHGAEVVNPTMGTAFAGAPLLFTIPAPSSLGSEVAGQPTLSRNNLPGSTGNPDINKMAIWGGTIVSLTYVFEDAPDGTTAQTETRLDIAFRSNNGSTALIAWAGHIAAEYDWGTGRGATGVSGSPYHTRIIEIDGKPGNQDRSLKATAVIIPPPLCGISAAQFACPETASLTFTNAGSSTGAGITYVWTLTNGNPSAGAQISGSNTGSSITVVPIGNDFLPGGTFNLSLTVNRVGAQSVTCTRVPAGTIVRVVVDATATPASLDLAVSNTSQLNAVLTGSDDVAAANYNFAWTQAPAAGGSLSAANIQNPVFTATSPGSYTFTVTATQKAAPFCTASDNVTVNVGSSTPPCVVAGPSPICPSSTNTYVYDPSGDGAADPIPANFTAVWTLENNTNNASKVGAAPHTGNSVSVTAGAVCNTSYRIRITLTSTSGLITSTCFKDVTVNDVTPPTITSCPADMVIECSASSLPTNTGTATATDNCSATVTFTDVVTPGCYTIITRTWKATDPCGNSSTCTQRIIKRDRTAPSITCPASGPATATDNCSTTINIFSRDAGTTRTWTAIDESGNVATCTQTISAALRNETVENKSIVTDAVVSKTVSTQSSVQLVEQTKVPLPKSDELSVQAFPNPYTNEVNFRFVSPVSGKALLEVYDLVGRKLGVVYQGNVEANIQRAVKYNVPALKQTPMVFKLSIGKLSSRGTLMPSQN